MGIGKQTTCLTLLLTKTSASAALTGSIHFGVAKTDLLEILPMVYFEMIPIQSEQIAAIGLNRWVLQEKEAAVLLSNSAIEFTPITYDQRVPA